MARAEAEEQQMDAPTRKRKRDEESEIEREGARKRKATQTAIAAAKAAAKPAVTIDPEELERRQAQRALAKQREEEDRAWRELNERAKRAGGAEAGPAEGGVAADGDEAWQETVEVKGRLSQQAAASDAGWAKWVPKGVKFKNRAERRAAAQAAQAAAEKGETATTVNSKMVRYAAGKTWEDKSLAEWPDNDFRFFVGDLGPDVTTQTLTEAFRHYKSFARARVVTDKAGVTKGFGFVSFLDADEYATAFKEMNGRFIGSHDKARPCKLKKSTWKDRLITSNKSQKKIQKLAMRDEIIQKQQEMGAL
eukprot:c1509_g1_i1.p1 GENE.c1509_g1_i1~~c1509_g1_i1.p1  ORF type:complete len:343 (+),score=84.17 c1509_g1_i1:111-1031(+)